MRYPKLLASAVLFLLPLAATAAVEVSYVDPEHYTDAGLRFPQREPSAALRHELETTLQGLGRRYLAADQTLTIEVLDLDLAGRFRWWDSDYGQVRVMEAVDWPRMRLRYRLQQGGREVARGEENLSDRNYLNEASARGGDPLGYEKNMLEDWFRSRFGSGGRPV